MRHLNLLSNYSHCLPVQDLNRFTFTDIMQKGTHYLSLCFSLKCGGRGLLHSTFCDMELIFMKILLACIYFCAEWFIFNNSQLMTVISNLFNSLVKNKEDSRYFHPFVVLSLTCIIYLLMYQNTMKIIP